MIEAATTPGNNDSHPASEISPMKAAPPQSEVGRTVRSGMAECVEGVGQGTGELHTHRACGAGSVVPGQNDDTHFDRLAASDALTSGVSTGIDYPTSQPPTDRAEPASWALCVEFEH